MVVPSACWGRNPSSQIPKHLLLVLILCCWAGYWLLIYFLLAFHNSCQFVSYCLQMWYFFNWLLLSVGASCKQSWCSWHLSIVNLDFQLCEWRRLCWCRCSGLVFLVLVFQCYSQSSSPIFFILGIWFYGNTRGVCLCHLLGQLPRNLKVISVGTILMLIFFRWGATRDICATQ